MRGRSRINRWARWVATFVGFPAAGVTARLVAGNIDSTGAALAGGLAGGAVLGAVQALVGGVSGSERGRWIGGTAAGLAIGLAAGGEAVGFRTGTSSLVALGAISGAVVGVAQALAMRAGRLDRVAWAIATPALWAGGWLITAQVIVDADRQHAVFGSSGAAAVSLVAGALVSRRTGTIGTVGTGTVRTGVVS